MRDVAAPIRRSRTRPLGVMPAIGGYIRDCAVKRLGDEVDWQAVGESVDKLSVDQRCRGRLVVRGRRLARMAPCCICA